MILEAYLKNYEENAAYTRFAKTRINAQASEIVKFTSKLAVFFFQAEDGIRDYYASRGLGDVYKRQQ